MAALLAHDEIFFGDLLEYLEARIYVASTTIETDSGPIDAQVFHTAASIQGDLATTADFVTGALIVFEHEGMQQVALEIQSHEITLDSALMESETLRVLLEPATSPFNPDLVIPPVLDGGDCRTSTDSCAVSYCGCTAQVQSQYLGLVRSCVIGIVKAFFRCGCALLPPGFQQACLVACVSSGNVPGLGGLSDCIEGMAADPRIALNACALEASVCYCNLFENQYQAFCEDVLEDRKYWMQVSGLESGEEAMYSALCRTPGGWIRATSEGKIGLNERLTEVLTCKQGDVLETQNVRVASPGAQTYDFRTCQKLPGSGPTLFQESDIVESYDCTCQNQLNACPKVRIRARVRGLEAGEQVKASAVLTPTYDFDDAEFMVTVNAHGTQGGGTQIVGLRDPALNRPAFGYPGYEARELRVETGPERCQISSTGVIPDTTEPFVVLEIDCGCDGGSCDREHRVGIDIDAETWNGVPGDGTILIEMKVYSEPDRVTPVAVEQMPVFGVGIPVYFETRIPDGYWVWLALRDQGSGMRCSVPFPNWFEARTDMVASVGCTVGPEYWCDLYHGCDGDCVGQWKWIGEGEIEVRDSVGTPRLEPQDVFYFEDTCDPEFPPTFIEAAEALSAPVKVASAPDRGAMVFLRNDSQATWSGVLELEGVARDDADGVTRIRALIDGAPAPLERVVINQVDGRTCSEWPTPDCRAASTFTAELDTTAYSNGAHTLTVVADRGEGTLLGMRNVELTFDNPGVANDAMVESVSFPSTLGCGQQATATVTMRNIGTDSWTAAAGYQLFALGSSDPLATGPSFPIPGGVTVAPQQTVSFTIPLDAPTTPGLYTSDWRMFQYGSGSFGGSVIRQVSVTCTTTTDNAAVDAVTFPSSLDCDQTGSATVTMRNTGTSSWIAADGYALEAVGGSDPLATTLSIPPVEPVGPGQSVTFSIPLRAPSAAGSYTSSWRMARSGTAFGATASGSVAVSCSGGGPDDNSVLVGDTLPTSLGCGAGASATITLRNTGSSTWSAAGGYRLGAVGGSDPLSNVLYIGLGSATVAPGQEHTFALALTAPTASGTYRSDWRMFHQGWSEFGATALSDVVVDCSGGGGGGGGGGGDTDAARRLGDTLPSSLGCGTVSATITVENIGNTTWTRAGGYKLGAVGGTDPFVGGTRVQLPSGVAVGPGQSHTFPLSLTAPGFPGWYETDWKMVREGVAWFGPEIRKDVEVTCTDGSGGGTDDGAYYDSDLPPSLECGQRVWAQVRVQNIGTTTWSQAAGYSLKALGGIDPLAGTDAMPFPGGVTVAPQETVSFARWFEGPSTAGSWLSDWQMHKQGTGLFGSPILLEVEVFCGGDGLP
ncbi:MAG: NBR1-Ig-like domain-containing protein [Acidobacteriota bacterium]